MLTNTEKYLQEQDKMKMPERWRPFSVIQRQTLKHSDITHHGATSVKNYDSNKSKLDWYFMYKTVNHL